MPIRLPTFSTVVLVRGIKSTKSCLHILAEKGNSALTKMLLDRLPSAARRSKLLEATVLTELEGQRPRHLASIHLAALHGHRQLVELFLENGIDVNARNNKNDTPVLWAGTLRCRPLASIRGQLRYDPLARESG